MPKVHTVEIVVAFTACTNWESAFARGRGWHWELIEYFNGVATECERPHYSCVLSTVSTLQQRLRFAWLPVYANTTPTITSDQQMTAPDHLPCLDELLIRQSRVARQNTPATAQHREQGLIFGIHFSHLTNPSLARVPF